MKLELEEPFKSLWRKAYLRISKKDGRKRVDLINTKQHRTTISYARYLKCVEIGGIIDENYEVDHIDNNKTNDELVNLQILSRAQHEAKTKLELTTGRTMLECVCPECGVSFEREARHTKGKANNFCSRICNGKFSSSRNSKFAVKGIDDQLKQQIKMLFAEGFSGYRISKILGISGNTALKYK